MKKFTRTSARSPRANSTFKTTETRETYRMAEEIKDILSKTGDNTIISCEAIVNLGNELGYCRPLVDDERIAQSHPYWKILSDMTDITSPLYVNNLEEIDWFGNVLCYRLRTDVHRGKNGKWRKTGHAQLLDSMPEDK